MNLFSSENKASVYSWPLWVSIALAIAAFFWVVGPLALNPQNLAWLDGGFDPTQHYLGWAFFRNSAWSFPLGLNPAFGMDISSSIVYSDSIPLLAFLFKPFSALLPETFQYFGLWLLLCFILQAYFAWRLMALLQLSSVATIGATLLFVFSPPMFWRIGLHAALVAHWVILAGLYLNFRSSRAHRFIYWALLLSVCALIHFYLLSMVLGLWLASLLDDWLIGLRSQASYAGAFLNSRSLRTSSRWGFSQGLVELVITLGVVVLVMWVAGYFVVSQSDAATQSFGISRMNILAPFDAQRWSYGLPSLPDTQGALSDMDMSARTYENFMYWGAGILVILVLAGMLFVWRCISSVSQVGHHQKKYSNPAFTDHEEGVINLSWSRHGILYLLLIGFTLLALSNQVALGPWSWTLPLPESLYQLASMYRASSRFFWPIWYTVAFVAIASMVRVVSPKGMTVLLVLCALVQIADTRAGWKSIRSLTMKPIRTELALELRDPFWVAAGSHYRQLVRIPVDPNWTKVLPPHWSTFANYAALHHMQTNSAYLARQSAQKLERSNSLLQQMLAAGQWDPQTLYLLGNEEVKTVLAKSDPERDLLAIINGHIVFAPGWLSCVTCPPIPAMLRITPNMVQTQLNQAIGFDTLGNGKYFLQGPNWAYPESWGTWALNQSAELTLPVPQALLAQTPGKSTLKLILEARALVNDQQVTQEVRISINGDTPISYSLSKDAHNQIEISLDQQVIQAGYVHLVFHFPHARRPKDMGMGQDERLLCLGLISATFK